MGARGRRGGSGTDHGRRRAAVGVAGRPGGAVRARPAGGRRPRLVGLSAQRRPPPALGSAAADRDRRPGADVDPVAVLERDRTNGWIGSSRAVDRGAVRRVLVDDRPGAVGLLDQDRVLVRDARVLGRHRQVDVGGLAGGVAAAADGDLVAGERQLLLGGVRGQVQARGLGAASAASSP